MRIDKTRDEILMDCAFLLLIIQKMAKEIMYMHGEMEQSKNLKAIQKNLRVSYKALNEIFKELIQIRADKDLKGIFKELRQIIKENEL